MNMRCKNGDLALVIRDNEGCEANVGRLVEVRGPVVSSMYGEKVTWQIAQVEQNTPWLIEENDGTIIAEIATWKSRVLHPDSWLTPIRPGANDEDEALWRALHAPKQEVQKASVQPEKVCGESAHEGAIAGKATDTVQAARIEHPQAISRSTQVLSRTAELWFA